MDLYAMQMCSYILLMRCHFFHLYLHGEALQCDTVGEACRVGYSVELERREGETKGNYYNSQVHGLC